MTEILLVASSERRAELAELLRGEDRHVIVVETADAARDVLMKYSPALLVAEIRLGPFNGLHVVIRHQESHPRMRAILLDRTYDPVLAENARQCGAAYLSEPIDSATLLECVSREIQRSNARRWPRKQPAQELTARIEGTSARVVDLSYGGLRLEIDTGSEVPAQLRIGFPPFEEAFVARAVWTHPVSSAMRWCGVELFAASAGAETEWRRFVDSIRATA